MKMRRWIVSILCLIMAIARFSAPVEAVQAEVSYDEATVLDQMANSWSETCKTNLVYCQMGLLKEIFAQPFESSKDAIKEQLLKDILTGYQGKTNIWCEINVNKFYDQLDNPGSLQDDIRTYLTTSADAEDLEERALHFRAKNSVNDIVNNGDIVEDLSLVDLIKENYALLVGEIACDSAIDFFNEALASDDLTVKREKMLYGAFLATIGCEMSIEDTDAIVKNEGKSTDDILNDIKKWETEKLYN